MSYIEKPVEQLGSGWLKEAKAKGRDEAIVEATRSGALADLMAGADPDGCPTCHGTGRRQ